MMYIMDKYGNKTVLNSTFEIVGLPFQREYSTAQIPGSDGEIQTTEPVVSSNNRSIVGQLVELTLEEAENKRRELADFCGRGLIKAGYEGEGWFIEGQCISFDHKYTAKTEKCVADVSITLKCDDPHQMAAQIEEELIITPSDYPTRIDIDNPHPAANLRFGSFDLTTGEKVSEESVWHELMYGIYTTDLGHGFTFDCYRGFSLSAFTSSGVRKFKVFIDGVFAEEVAYTDTEKFDIRYSITFEDSFKHVVTIFNTQMTLYVDYIYPVPANLPVVTNPGTVEDYPVMEVEPADTEALFSPLGKKVGDAEHPFEIAHFYRADPLAEITPTTSATPTQEHYDLVAFLDGRIYAPITLMVGRFAAARLKFDLKSPNSPYYGMTVTEIKDNIQSILSELWGYSKGAIEVGDPSFESGVNGFDTNNGAVISQSAEWAKTGTKSLKIIADGTNQFAYTRKIYGNQAGKKLTASVWVRNNELTPANIRVNWLDITSGASGSIVQTTILAQTETKITLPEYIVPADSQDVRLIIYPAFGVLEPATIYIDDVTVTTYGIELYCWSGGWSHLATLDHAYDFPKLMRWESSSAGGSLPYYINDGKICFLIKAKYPSDVISSSAVYIDHCRLGTTMNYAKLGADAITNYGGNLLDNGWGEYYATKGYSLGHIFVDLLYTHDGEKKVYPGQKVVLSYEGWRDTEAVKNNIHPAILILHDLIDGTYIGYEAPVSLFADIPANKWERRTVTVDLKDDNNMGSIKAVFYRNPNTTLQGKIGIRNAFIADGDKIIKLQPQDLRVLEFSEDIVLTKGDLITADTKRREVNKNEERLYQLINQSFKFHPLQIFGGLNHFRINHSGANLKVRLKYQPKWR